MGKYMSIQTFFKRSKTVNTKEMQIKVSI